jgi:glyoxylase-like metal-dependent hydrolase (beta-lactamase superfamily II)
MRRALVCGALLSIGALSLAAAGLQGQAPSNSTKIRRIEPVRDNLYWIPGGDPDDRTTWSGGNVGVFVTEKGVVLVDTMLAGRGQAILEQVRSVTDRPVTMIINTHTHNDHSGSNTEFPASVEFVAHENTKANMSKPTCPPVTNCDAFKGDKATFLPKTTFTDKRSLLSGKDQIDLYHFGPGHTNGDAWIVFPAVRAMHSGDMFARKRVPNIDVNNGGSGVAFSATLAKTVAGIRNVDTIITGHSPLMTWEDLKEYADFHRDFLATVQTGLKAGKSPDEVAKTYTVPEKYKGYRADPQRVQANVQAIHDELNKSR